MRCSEPLQVSIYGSRERAGRSSPPPVYGRSYVLPPPAGLHSSRTVEQGAVMRSAMTQRQPGCVLYKFELCGRARPCLRPLHDQYCTPPSPSSRPRSRPRSLTKLFAFCASSPDAIRSAVPDDAPAPTPAYAHTAPNAPAGADNGNVNPVQRAAHDPLTRTGHRTGVAARVARDAGAVAQGG